jgi:hypothetical protein
VRFTERSCEQWARAGLEAQRDAAHVVAASGWLQVHEDAAWLDIAGDVGFTAEDGIERRVIIRDQRIFTFFGCR